MKRLSGWEIEDDMDGRPVKARITLGKDDWVFEVLPMGDGRWESFTHGGTFSDNFHGHSPLKAKTFDEAILEVQGTMLLFASICIKAGSDLLNAVIDDAH